MFLQAFLEYKNFLYLLFWTFHHHYLSSCPAIRDILNKYVGQFDRICTYEIVFNILFMTHVKTLNALLLNNELGAYAT